MRLRHLACRIFMAPALLLALALTAVACGNSGSSSSTPAPASHSSAPASSPAPSPSSPTATPASSSSGPGGNSAAAATITANWEKFFSGSTSAANKIALLQNGTNYAAIIKAQSGSGLASTAGAKVKAVVVNSPTTATVSYDITLSGTTALPNQTGTAVYEGGTWKVSDAAFCQLVKLENNGTAPSVCG